MSHLITTNKIYRSTLLTGAVLLGISPHLQAQASSCVPLPPAPATVSINGAPAIANQVIVKLRNDIDISSGIAIQQELQAQTLKQFPSIGAQLWQVNGIDTAAAIQKYQTDPRVEYIEPNYIVKPVATPNDPDFAQLWGLHNTGQTGGTSDADIDAPEAWDITTGKSNVVVAVIDTGIDYKHPDLVANMWKNAKEIPGNLIDDDKNGYVDDVYGYDFYDCDPDPMDVDEHGTHVSGTIAGVGNNGVGVTGVNWQAKVMALKFIGANGGTVERAICAIEYATKMGVKISNNSWGCQDCYSNALYDAIKTAGGSGHLFVAAAGNAGMDNDNPCCGVNYPSSYDLDNIIAVAATDHKDTLADFSNYGATKVDLGAPGVDIYSTIPGSSYASFSGTSMATPHVAGVAGLLLACKATATYTDLKQRILSTVDPKAALAGKMVSGGRLNAYKAVDGYCPPPPSPFCDAANPSPKALFTNTITGLCVDLDGSASVACEPGATLVKYIWEVSNKVLDLDSTPPEGAKVKVCFDEPGPYSLYLTVVDSKGRTDSAGFKIEFTLPPLGNGVNTKGQPLPTATEFAGGITVKKNGYVQQNELALVDPVKVAGKIIVEPAHVGKTADIFVYAETTLPPLAEIFYFMLGEDMSISLWDLNPAHLVPFLSGVTLEGGHEVPIYDGNFVYPGTLKVFFGYRLADGTAIRNTTPIDIIINQ